MKKKVLILNGSHSELLLIKAAKELGLYVITTGNRPELIGHQFADQYISADYTDKEAVLKIARSEKIDFVCACANDAGATTAAYVAELMGLPGHDSLSTLNILLHKDKFKEFALPRKYPTPRAISFSNRAPVDLQAFQMSYPVIVKPADRSGGKGISVARDESSFLQAVKTAYDESPKSTIVVEEFIEGTLHSFSTFLINQKVAACFGDNEYSTVNPYTVSTSAAPATGLEKVKQELIDVSESMAKELNLVDGVFHHQYIYDGQRPHILEITRRCSGDVYPYPVKLALGLDWAKWIVRAEIGSDMSGFPKVQQKGFFGRHCIMADQNGILESYHLDASIKENVVDMIYAVKPGDSVTNFMTQKLAVAILRFSTQEEMLHKVPNMHSLMSVVCRSPSN